MKQLFIDTRIFLILFFLSLIFVFLDNINLLIIPKSAAQFITTPIQYGIYQYGSSIKKQYEFILASRYAAKENIAIRIQLADLLSENASLHKQLVDARNLMDQHDSLSPVTYHLLSAHLIGVGRYLTLDKGSNDGVTIGQAVVYKDNFIGKVNEVNPRTSLILLPQDPDSKLSVFAQGNIGKAKGIMIGQFGSNLLMDKILHQEPVNVNDLVYSEGIEGQIPRGLILGKITKVMDRQNEVFKQAEVSPIYNPDDLDVVSIILGS